MPKAPAPLYVNDDDAAGPLTLYGQALADCTTTSSIVQPSSFDRGVGA